MHCAVRKLVAEHALEAVLGETCLASKVLCDSFKEGRPEEAPLDRLLCEA